MVRTAAEIKQELHAPDFDSIVVWKPAAGASADERITFENAREAALRPVYGAKYGPLELLLNAEEYVALARERTSTTSPRIRHEQRVSFATGNLGIEEASVTREYVAAVAKRAAR